MIERKQKMNMARKHFKLLVLLGCALALTAVIAAGCKKKQAASSIETKEADSAAIEQTTCPVMEGNPIDKNVFVMYKGKKVYFCCESCKAEFEKNPEKYVSKLPQFKK
jgi:YHS domain-containing protein